MNENNNDNRVQPVVPNTNVDVTPIENLENNILINNSQVINPTVVVPVVEATVSNPSVVTPVSSQTPVTPVTPPNNVATSVNPMAKAQQQLIDRMKDSQEVVQPMEEVVITGDVKKENNVKYILTGLFFVMLLFMIIFLPEISALVNTIMNPVEEEKVITSGKLVCDINETTAKYSLEYSNTFMFTDSKVKSLDFVAITKGDKNLDKLALEKMNNECKDLNTLVEEYDGINVICEIDSGVNTVKQKFNYENIDSDLLSAAYAEVGGIYPQFYLDQDIEDVEKSMIASGYSCKRS